MDKKLKFVWISCLGAAFEYFDFIIYGMMTPYIREIFFINNSSTNNLLKTFCIVAVGYFARPLGGFLFGLYSDIYGRKKSLVLVMSLMALSTLSMGMLPDANHIGIAAPILLTLCRALQGISMGAEMPNVMSIVKENIPSHKSGMFYGYIMAATAVGAFLASLFMSFMSNYFTHNEIIGWAWRIPFFTGGILASIVYFIRRSTFDTEVEIKQSSLQLIKDLFKNYKPHLAVGIFIPAFFAYLITVTLYLPVYLSTHFNYPLPQIFLNVTAGLLVPIITSPLFGKFITLKNQKTALQITALLFPFFLWIMLGFLKTGSSLALTIFLLGYQIFIAIFSTHCLSILSDLFSKNVRATGIGLCYNISFCMGSLIPLFLTHFIHPHNHIDIMMMLSIFIAIITIIAYQLSRYLKKTF
jgi:MFS family permease